MKKTIYVFLSVILFSNMSCTKEDLSPQNATAIESAPFELIAIDGFNFDNGVYEAKIGEVTTKVIVNDHTIKWMVPNLKMGRYVMTIVNGEVDYNVIVFVNESERMNSPSAFLRNVIDELELGITKEELTKMSEDELRVYAQFVKVNYDQIVNAIPTNASNTKSIEYNKINVGESVSFTVTAKNKWNGSTVFVNQGEVYEVVASGMWTDWFVDTDAEGFSKWYLSLAGFLKRAPNENWFKLIASIDRKENYPVGSSSQIIATESGKLEFFANDVMGFYWNNKGDLQVTVTRKQ